MKTRYGLFSATFAVVIAGSAIAAPPSLLSFKNQSRAPATPPIVLLGNARAMVDVSSDGTVLGSKKIRKVTNPEPGVYCVQLNDKIDVASTAAVVSIDWAHSSNFADFAFNYGPGFCSED